MGIFSNRKRRVWVFLALSHIDASSAKEAKTKQYPIQTMKNAQTRPARPPFSKPKIVELMQISHVLMAVLEKPRIEMKRKLRYGG